MTESEKLLLKITMATEAVEAAIVEVTAADEKYAPEQAPASSVWPLLSRLKVRLEVLAIDLRKAGLYDYEQPDPAEEEKHNPENLDS